MTGRRFASTIAGAAGLIAVTTLLARAAGFARVLVFTESVRTGGVAGIYQSVNAIPNVMFEIAAGGILAAVAVHDGVLSPLAAVADAVLRFCLRWFPHVPAWPTTINYVRVPALGAALTFLMFLPGIIRQGEPVVRGQTGLDQSPFLVRWLLLVAAMAAVSALVYGVRRLTRR